MSARRPRIALVVVAAAAILAATTFPTRATDVGRVAVCIACGDRGVADALLNILLFVPLGAALALSGWPLRGAAAGAGLFSALIELAQLFVIPGRDPSVGDVLFNTVGAAVGVALAMTSKSWLTPAPGRASVLVWIWSGVVALSIGGTAALLAPALSRLPYYGGWTMRLGHLAWYRGRVVDAHLGSSPLPRSLLEDSERARAALLAGEPVRTLAIAGPRPRALAPVVMINDGAQHEMMLLGIDRDDLVFRYRTRSTALRLDQPDLRAGGATQGVAPGDSLRLAAWREGAGYCLEQGVRRRCGIGYTAGRAWGLLLYRESFPHWLMSSLDAAWMLALFVPLGFWFWLGTRNPLALMPAAIALIGAPSFTRLLPSLGESLAALAGLVGGMLLARLVLSADRATYGRGSDQMRMVPISTTAPPVKRRDTRP